MNIIGLILSHSAHICNFEQLFICLSSAAILTYSLLSLVCCWNTGIWHLGLIFTSLIWTGVKLLSVTGSTLTYYMVNVTFTPFHFIFITEADSKILRRHSFTEYFNTLLNIYWCSTCNCAHNYHWGQWDNYSGVCSLIIHKLLVIVKCVAISAERSEVSYN